MYQHMQIGLGGELHAPLTRNRVFQQTREQEPAVRPNWDLSWHENQEWVPGVVDSIMQHGHEFNPAISQQQIQEYGRVFIHQRLGVTFDSLKRKYKTSLLAITARHYSLQKTRHKNHKRTVRSSSIHDQSPCADIQHAPIIESGATRRVSPGASTRNGARVRQPLRRSQSVD